MWVEVMFKPIEVIRPFTGVEKVPKAFKRGWDRLLGCLGSWSLRKGRLGGMLEDHCSGMKLLLGTRKSQHEEVGVDNM